MAKKVLIFHSKTGGGHLRIAQSIAKKITKLDPNIKVVLADGLKQTSYDPETAYLLSVTSLSIPTNLAYLLVNNKICNYLSKLVLKKKFGNNLKKIIDQEKPDLIISVHSFICPATISDYQKIQIPFFQVVVNLSLNIWEADAKSDKVFVPTKEWFAFAKKYISYEQIVLSGFPLSEGFIPIKHTLNNQILIMGGGNGVGDLKRAVFTLCHTLTDKEISIVCGKNESLQTELEKDKLPNLTVFGFVDNTDQLIKQADLVITKAGAVSLLEAATVGRPIIVTSWKGMWEKYNLLFIKENNLGLYCPNLKNLPRCVADIYQNYDKFVHPEKIIQGGALKIAEEVLATI